MYFLPPAHRNKLHLHLQLLQCIKMDVGKAEEILLPTNRLISLDIKMMPNKDEIKIFVIFALELLQNDIINFKC